MRFARQAFTLIELLVVISIIALLLAVLMPALGAARDTAIAAVCLSQQRQMAAASFAYAIDHADLLPPTNSRFPADLMPDGDPRGWDRALGVGGYIPFDPYTRQDDSPAHCPRLQRLGGGKLYQYAPLGGNRLDVGVWAFSQAAPGGPIRPVFDGHLFYGPAPTRVVDQPSRFLLLADPARVYWPGSNAYVAWIGPGTPGQIGLSANTVGRQIPDPAVNDDWYLHREAPIAAMLDGSAGVVPDPIRDLQHRYLASQPVQPGRPDLVAAGRYFYPKPGRAPSKWTTPLN